MPTRVEVIEVGMRDGLQMESSFVPTATKVDLVNRLTAAGIRHIEATSFVSPRAVPQLADAEVLLAQINRPAGVEFSVLTPNRKGVERAIAARADSVVVFLSASESHNSRNLNRPVARSLDDAQEIAELLAGTGIAPRGAVAVAFGCPFEGDVPLSSLKRIVGHFQSLGFGAVTLGDTTGMATPALVQRTVAELRSAFPGLHLSLHFHNTRGLGLVNVAAGLREGISSFESSVGGLGGCPFAPGASGNICTEDMVNMLHEMGIETGIDLDQLLDAALQMQAVLGRTLPGQVMKAGPRTRLHVLNDAACAVG